MNYPLISEYIEAIKAAEDNFEQLKQLRPVLDDDGLPVMTSGNFAVVFKMKDEQTGKLHAVKCFLREQEGRAEAYRQIAEELEYVSSTFLTPIKYLDKELFVDTSNSDESEFPVLLMDWVEGQTLDKYIREHINDEYELSLLAYQFSRLAMWLLPQPFAHGDLKPDNILVKDDGTLVLVDYDGMYVPAMKGQRARELGSPDFRHPSRTEDDFDEHIDDFSLVSILLSLKAIALQPELLEQYGAKDRLLFSERDYRNLSESQVMDAIKALMTDTELATLYSLFILSSAQNNLSQASFRLLNLKRPQAPVIEDLSTEEREDDYDNGWWDDNGIEYSKDGERLITALDDKKYYIIRKGTIIICNNAFEGCVIDSIQIPTSVVKIGDSSFAACELSPLSLPSSLIEIGNYAFGESTISAISLNEGLKKIGDDAFRLSRLISITIPHSVKIIGNHAFYECEKLSSVTFLNSNVKFGIDVFYGCCSLRTIIIPRESKKTFEELLPDFKDILVEQNDEEICLACCTEQSRACEDKDYALWQPNAKIIKKNGKLGVVIDDGNTKKQIIPFVYDTWFDYDGHETEIREDFFDNYQDYIGYFAIKNADGTFTIHGFDKEGSLTTSFTCEKFNPDSFKLNGKWFLRNSADGEEYDDIVRMGMHCETNLDTCYLAFRKGNLWSLKSDDLKITYIDYIECDGFGQMYWTPKGFFVEIKTGEKSQICLCKKNTKALVIPDKYDYVSLHYFSRSNHGIDGACFEIRRGNKIAVCSNDLQSISPFIFDIVGAMINENEVKVVRKVDGKEYDFIYRIVNGNGWRVKDSRPFSPDEMAAVYYADVIATQYGLSARFKMKNKFGGYKFLPLSAYSTLSAGSEFNMTNALLITLCREGEDDIYRVIE